MLLEAAAAVAVVVVLVLEVAVVALISGNSLFSNQSIKSCQH
jgi:hypothetical protein